MGMQDSEGLEMNRDSDVQRFSIQETPGMNPPRFPHSIGEQEPREGNHTMLGSRELVDRIGEPGYTVSLVTPEGFHTMRRKTAGTLRDGILWDNLNGTPVQDMYLEFMYNGFPAGEVSAIEFLRMWEQDNPEPEPEPDPEVNLFRLKIGSPAGSPWEPVTWGRMVQEWEGMLTLEEIREVREHDPRFRSYLGDLQGGCVLEIDGYEYMTRDPEPTEYNCMRYYETGDGFCTRSVPGNLVCELCPNYPEPKEQPEPDFPFDSVQEWIDMLRQNESDMREGLDIMGTILGKLREIGILPEEQPEPEPEPEIVFLNPYTLEPDPDFPGFPLIPDNPTFDQMVDICSDCSGFLKYCTDCPGWEYVQNCGDGLGDPEPLPAEYSQIPYSPLQEQPIPGGNTVSLAYAGNAGWKRFPSLVDLGDLNLDRDYDLILELLGGFLEEHGFHYVDFDFAIPRHYDRFGIDPDSPTVPLQPEPEPDVTPNWVGWIQNRRIPRQK